jgi:peptide deformylase
MKVFNMRDLVPTDDLRLRKVSKKVALPLSDEDFGILQGMAAFTMESQAKEKDDNGDDYISAIGMAAPQFGINKRMFVIAMTDDNGKIVVYAVVNPEIQTRSKKNIILSDGESCLSVIGGESKKVSRSESVRWKGTLIDLETGDEDTKYMSGMKGYLGIVFQHEYDHLDGILYIDKYVGKPSGFGDPIDPESDTSISGYTKSGTE